MRFRCIDCRQEKTKRAFWPDRSRPTGLMVRCKSCHHVYTEVMRTAPTQPVPDGLVFQQRLGLVHCHVCRGWSIGIAILRIHGRSTVQVRCLMCDGERGDTAIVFPAYVTTIPQAYVFLRTTSVEELKYFRSRAA